MPQLLIRSLKYNINVVNITSDLCYFTIGEISEFVTNLEVLLNLPWNTSVNTFGLVKEVTDKGNPTTFKCLFNAHNISLNIYN
jgi:hypothetical protein